MNVVCKSQKEAGMSFQWTIVNLLHASEQYLGHDELHSLSGSAELQLNFRASFMKSSHCHNLLKQQG